METWLSTSREISRLTNITGKIWWEEGNFSQGKRNPLSEEVLLKRGFTSQKKEGCSPDYTEYHLKIDEEKEIILFKDFNVFSEKEYFTDHQFDWPTDLHLRKFFFEDQIDAYIEWTKRVTLKAYKENMYL